MTQVRKLVLVGGGGTATDVCAIVRDINRYEKKYELVGVLDDRAEEKMLVSGVPVLGGLDAWSDWKDCSFVDCLGGPGTYLKRAELLRGMLGGSAVFETIVHPTAFIADDVKLGEGVIIYPYAVLLSGVSLGEHVTVLASSVLNHDVSIGAWSLIASNVSISGAVKVEETCYVGAGSNLREGIRVRKGGLVAMGAAVIKDTGPYTVTGGVPGKPICT